MKNLTFAPFTENDRAVLRSYAMSNKAINQMFSMANRAFTYAIYYTPSMEALYSTDEPAEVVDEYSKITHLPRDFCWGNFLQALRKFYFTEKCNSAFVYNGDFVLEIKCRAKGEVTNG